MHFKIKLSAVQLKNFKIKNDSTLVTFVIKNKLKEQLKYLSEKLGLPEGWLKPDIINFKNNMLELNPVGSDLQRLFIYLIEKPDKLSVDYFRNKLSELPEKLKNLSTRYLQVLIPDYENFKDLFDEEKYYLQTFAEGILLGNYQFTKYKSEKEKSVKLEVIFYGNSNGVNKAVNRALRLIESVYFTRDLVNEPAISLTPQELAKRVKKHFEKSKVKVSVFDSAKLKKLKMNAILSVGAGSSNKPLMILLHYKAEKPRKKFALVGKGVTYDSGGLSLKPTDSMLEMKGDMAGAAAVIGALDVARKFNLPFEIYGVIPAVENLINGSSYKPGDIVTTSSGKSIEVKNTDAEGRIILADALEFASAKKPDFIIDFATLTGACVVALGELMAGLFTKSDELKNKLIKAGNKTYELLWALPFNDEYNKLLKSDIADIKNLGSRWGGAITAAKFLEFFVNEKIDYVHLDIAGPALKNDFTNYWKKWNTGFGVRLMAEFFDLLES